MNQNKVSDYRDKILRHRLSILYRVIVVIAICIICFVVIKLYRDNQVFHTYEIVHKNQKVGTASSVYRNYQGNVLTYSKDGMSAYDVDGNQLWNQTYEMQDPIVKVNGEYVVACDYQGSMFYVMNHAGPVTSVETNMQILALDVSKEGVIAAALMDDEIIYLKMYAQSGELISEIKTSMRQSGYPTSFAVSPDNIKVGISYLKAEAGKVNTSLAYYNFGGVGQNETDNLVSGYDYDDQIFPLLVYPNETTSVAVGEHKILIMKGKQKPTLDKEIEHEDEIHAFYYNEENFAVVTQNHDQAGKYVVTVYDMNGKEQFKHEIDFSYKDIIVEDNRVIIYNETNVEVIGMNAVEKYNGDLGGNIQSLIPVGTRNELLVVFDDGIELIKLR